MKGVSLGSLAIQIRMCLAREAHLLGCSTFIMEKQKN